MSAHLRTRERFVRLRTIQHRAATIEVADASAELANLQNVGDRIEALRGKLRFQHGAVLGQTMQAICEMSCRLDAAAAGLIAPMVQAEAALEDKRVIRIDAHNREKGATKLKDIAEIDASKAEELRADANRPFRPTPRVGGR